MNARCTLTHVGCVLVLAVIGGQACSSPLADPSPHRLDRSKGGGDDSDGKETQNGGSVTDGYNPDGTPTKCGDPTPLVAFKGGPSIALRWSIIGQGADGIAQYVVYRDGAKVATLTPGFHPEFPEKDGKGYVDKNIAAGASYEYRVETVDAKGTATRLGAPLCVVAPAQLSSPPVIQFDLTEAPDLATVATSAKAFLEIWYPKVAFALALPDVTPFAGYGIRYDTSYTGLAYADVAKPEIVINPQWTRDHPQDFGMFIHESTHILNNARGTPGWIVEGIADYAREYIVHDRDPSPIGPNQHYSQGYSQASFFLNWIQEKHTAPLVRALVIDSHENTYSPSVFVKLSGKTIGGSWQDLTGQHERDPGPVRFKQLANKCIDGANGHAQVATCNGSDAQAWTWGAQKDGSIWISTVQGSGNCLDIQSSGTAAGSTVQTYGCNGSGAQSWRLQPNGSLLNPQSGRCLDNPNGSTANGTNLRIWDCTGAASQTFTLPQ